MKVNLTGLEFLYDFLDEFRKGLEAIAIKNLRYFMVLMINDEEKYIIDKSTFAKLNTEAMEIAPHGVFDDFQRGIQNFKKDARLYPVKYEAKYYGYLIIISKVYKPQQALLQLLMNTLALRLTSKLRERDSNNCSIGIMQSAIRAIEAKDKYTRGHSERVAQIAELLAGKLAIPISAIRQVKFASLLHDIGKIGISERVLTKKKPLSDAEWHQINLHPRIGVEILEPMELLHPIIPGVLNHHERFDGQGYPNGLVGEDIPLAARIISLADAYDAMTSNRAYRRAFSASEALKEIRRGAGAQFDPNLADKFVSLISENVYLSKPMPSQDLEFA